MNAGSPIIEQLLRKGVMPAWQIALEAGVTPTAVYEVSKKIGVTPPRAKRGEQAAVFPPPKKYAPRSRAEILADLAQQLNSIEWEFRRQIRADRQTDPVV